VYVEEPGLSRIVLHEVRTGPEYFASVLHDLHVQYTSFLMQTVRDAERDGELPAGTDAELVRSLVYGGIEHRMWGTLFGRGVVDVEVMADAYTELVLRGILPPGVEAKANGRAGSGDVERRLARLERLVAAQAEAPSPIPKRRTRRDTSDTP
jgi:hypothetical protein